VDGVGIPLDAEFSSSEILQVRSMYYNALAKHTKLVESLEHQRNALQKEQKEVKNRADTTETMRVVLQSALSDCKARLNSYEANTRATHVMRQKLEEGQRSLRLRERKLEENIEVWLKEKESILTRNKELQARNERYVNENRTLLKQLKEKRRKPSGCESVTDEDKIVSVQNPLASVESQRPPIRSLLEARSQVDPPAGRRQAASFGDVLSRRMKQGHSSVSR